MENITWKSAAACPSCGYTFIESPMLVIELTPEELINGPYPEVNMSKNRKTCPKCGCFANEFDYTPEKVKFEFQEMRERFLDIKEAELTVFFKAIKDSNPESYEELYKIVLEVSPSLSEVIKSFKSILTWICLMGGSVQFFEYLFQKLK